MPRSSAPFAVVVAAFVLAASATFTTGFSSGGLTIGRDVSFPNCGTQLPLVADFGVLGVNDGTMFTRNPCLASELGWAKRLPGPPAFYMNTGNPGAAYAPHWPIGQQWPFACRASNPNGIACSFDYGWNAGLDAFSKAEDGAQQLHGYDRATAHQRVANVDWWLDVEILNSWQTLEGVYGLTHASGLRDSLTIAGALLALEWQGVDQVGIYSTTWQWNTITGGRAVLHGWFQGVPVWFAGFESRDHAASGCSLPSFTNGRVVMTQYLGSDRLDNDVRCG